MSALRSSLLLLLLVGVLSYAAQLTSGRALSVQDAKRQLSTEVLNLVNQRNGPVVSNPISFYFFYYGDFTDPNSLNYYTPGLIKQFLTDISGSSYLNIMTQYTGADKKPVTLDVSYAGHTFITNYPYGKVLQTNSQNCFDVLIKKFIEDYHVPVSVNTQYYILYSSDVSYVTNAGPCETGDVACGYHKNFVNSTTKKHILWGQVGTPTSGINCDGLSGPYTVPSNIALSVLSHEIFETMTDPLASSWYDNMGQEIGDKCGYNYGTTFPSTFRPGAKYNLKLNGHEYLVQTEWSNEITGCAISRGNPPAPTPSASSKLSSLPLPSTSVSAAKGSSPSSSPAVPPSSSVQPSNSVAPSFNQTTGVCFQCPKPTCDRLRQVERVCRHNLKGRLTTTNNGRACCSNVPTTFSFSWVQAYDVFCDYSLTATKLYKLCLAIGGTISCEQAAVQGLKLTCSR